MLIQDLNLPLTWSVLYFGFKNNYISPKALIRIINKNPDSLNLTEQLLIDFNVNEEDNFFLERQLKELSKNNLKQGIRIWQLALLIEIQKMNISKKEKLEKIANLWADFDYPDSWRSFIYYMPELGNPYNNFLQFIQKEKNVL
ncbi:MAG: DUF2247 family protein [Bacteroidetes bacterium]|nr:DUF2247 family protein [Bacteroidota bacterium]